MARIRFFLSLYRSYRRAGTPRRYAIANAWLLAVRFPPMPD